MFSGAVDSVPDVNPKNHEKLVRNLSNHINVKLYTIEKAFPTI
jgi:hypothetical protein